MTRILRLLLAGFALCAACGGVAVDSDADGDDEALLDTTGESGADGDGEAGGDGDARLEAEHAPDVDADPDVPEETVADGDGDADAEAAAEADGEEAGETESGDVMDVPTHTCGNRVHEPPWEECDDGDRTDWNGCTTECLFSCHFDTDCAADENPCTAELCVEGGTGRLCESSPTDTACDDGNPCTAGDTCSAGACVPGAPLPVWWRDADGDAYGDPDAETRCANVAPDGFVDNHADCCDADALVFPGQTMWFSTRSSLCGTDVSAPFWDYDCSGTAERERPDCGMCSPDPGGGACRLVTGWQLSGDGTCTPPACGLYWYWITSCTAATCVANTMSSQQRCR